MRKLIVQNFVTLNGLAAGPDGSIAFIPASTAGDRSFGRSQEAFIASVDTILLGRVTYEMFSQYWPNVTSGDEKPFADKVNAVRKVVVSRSLERAPWGSFDEAEVVNGNATDAIAGMKRQAGKNIVLWGSISLAQSLMKDGLVDEYQLVVCPVAPTGGRPLFDADPGLLQLARTRSFDRGAVLLAYEASRTS